jgi:phage shock protein PspC (stress-responsive transcriptional regulator)
MKQVININFQGRVVPIEVTAFEILKNYIESLNRHFSFEDGKEEIINDIENRIGELFQERINKGATCVTDSDVNAIIASMGRPEDFETSEENQNTAAQNAQQKSENNNSHQSYNTTGQKRLYRDENNKVLGGVCSGLAHYFNMDITLVRIIFLILFFSFGFGLIPYIILWIVVPNSADKIIGSTRKKLYRDNDDKIIAGVCSGIGNYFGINAWIPRVLFVLPFISFVFKHGNDFSDFLKLTFSPGSLIIYIILWLVLPEAVTTAEKLEMKGEKVDIDSIKNSVVEEMKGVKQRTEKFGKEAVAYAQEKGKAMGAEIGTTTKRTGRSLGDVIALLFKIFAYFILGCIAFGLFMGLIGLGIAAIGLFPLKDFLISEGWQNAFAWGTLIFFIAVPIIGILTWLIRRITKVKSNSRLIRASFIGMWVLGWVCLMLLLSSVSRDFKRTNENLVEQEVFLSNPTINKLTITSQTRIEKYIRNRWLRFEPFSGIDEDTAYIRNFDIQIVKSPNDSFKITMIKIARGRTKNLAQEMADRIQYNGIQQDSIVQFDKGIAINKTDKFRNQRIVLRIYVPIGKQIKIDDSMGWYNNIHFDTPFNDDDFDIDFNDEEHGWQTNINYIMRKEGLYTLDGKPAKDRSSSRKKIKIKGNNVEIIDGNEKIKINRNGVSVEEDDDDDRKERLLDSLNDKQEREKDSLESKQKKEIEKVINSNPLPSAFLIPVGYAGMSKII